MHRTRLFSEAAATGIVNFRGPTLLNRKAGEQFLFLFFWYRTLDILIW